MPDSASAQLFWQRLKVCLRPLHGHLKAFLEEADTTGELGFLFLPEGDIRTAYECLMQLGLTQDAKRLAQAWHPLNRWILVDRLNEHFASFAAELSPEGGQWLRGLFGGFPSAEELAASAEERERRNNKAVMLARQLAEQLEQLQVSLSGETTKPCPGSEKSTGDPRTAPREQMSLRARVTVFLGDRAEALGRLPTFEELRQAFPDDIRGSRATFYRENSSWYTSVRQATKTLLQRDTPRRGHRNVSDHGESASVDGSTEAPNYHQDEAG